MNILKVSVLTAIATAARLISGFIVIKLVAIFAGPEGVAQLGQLMSLTALLVVFAGGGIGPGIVKYVAEYKGDNQRIAQLLSAGVSCTLLASLIMGALVLIFSRDITILLMNDSRYESLIVILAIAQALVAMHNFIVAVVNGMMDVRRLATIHVCGAIAGLLISAVLAYFLKLYGALLAFIIGQAFLLFVSLYFFSRSDYFNWRFFKPSFGLMHIKGLSKFSLMTLTSALLAPLVQIFVRNHLAEKFSWEDVGYWQAVSKVSESYLLFITMAISVYYLPKLSALTEKTEFKKEIKNAYVFLMPVVILSACFIYLFRDLITYILFSNDFKAANYLYAPQLIGDVIKIASFVLSYIMLAKAMIKTFFFSELAFSSMYVGWVIVLTDYFGLIGAMYAFIINYLIYLIFTACVASLFVRKM